jgi:hypothetical protein
VVLTSGFPELKVTGSAGVPTATRLLSKSDRKEDLAQVSRPRFWTMEQARIEIPAQCSSADFGTRGKDP